MADITIGATLPMNGRARTPKEMPMAAVGRISGSAARAPSR
jgi:hypothetical protein